MAFQGLAYEIAAVMPAAIATGLFASLCTIQQLTGAYGPSGAPVQTWENVAGLVNIPCMDEPPSEGRIQATEVKDLAEIMSLNLRHILLSGYFGQLFDNTGWRAVITEADGVTVNNYDILGAESDSQGTMTRLEVRIAEI
jgi:hypothetical protein